MHTVNPPSSCSQAETAVLLFGGRHGPRARGWRLSGNSPAQAVDGGDEWDQDGREMKIEMEISIAILETNFTWI